jgi:outer membrane protein assembly factor BamB
MSRVVFAFLLLVVLIGTVSAVEQWSQFRGPQAGVATDDPSLPDFWTETRNVAWKIDVPGQGWSSPVVWDDHIFVTTAISSGKEPVPIEGIADPSADAGRMKSESSHRWILYDIDFKTGSIRWQRELQNGVPPIARHIRNSYASETPVTDGQRVYVYFASIGVLAAFDLNGSPAWTKQIGAFESNQGWGMAGSPILHRGRIYIVNDNKVQSFIAAFDAKTGEQVWKVNREEPESWSTPFVWETPQRAEIVTAGSRRVRSYALDGSLLWELAGMSDFGPIPTPFVQNGLLYVSSGYPGSARRPVFAIRPGASGDISLKEGQTSNSFIAWLQPLLGSYQTSGLVYGGCYYTLLDRGFLLCNDPRTGEPIYGRQRIASGANFAASPWAYNGKVFLLSEEGDTYVIQAGKAFKVLGKNPLGEMAMASPAIARGSVIIRTQSKLYRIAKAGGK